MKNARGSEAEDLDTSSEGSPRVKLKRLLPGVVVATAGGKYRYSIGAIDSSKP